MNKRVAVLNPATVTQGKFGRQSAGRGYKFDGKFWAAVDFNKGMKSMREGALDAYDTLMVRMRWNNKVTVRSMIVWNGRTFAVRSFNDDRKTNQIQLLIREDTGQDLSGLVPYDPSNSAISNPVSETEIGG